MNNARLPDAPWQHVAGLRIVLAALHDTHGGPRYVGGAVRDTLLGLTVADVDIATTLLPQNVIDRLEAANVKAIPTGIDHGTITAAIDGKNYEITTLRRDVATDGRRAIVAFSEDWREDAARRDFTINALYADPDTCEIFDYFGGRRDLEDGVLRFIGEPAERIAEDFLRILRYFRFLARYGSGPLNQDALEACEQGAHGLTALSRERIAQELARLLSLKDPVQSVRLMQQHGIFTPFLPELATDAADRLEHLVAREQLYDVPTSLASRFLAILKADPASVDKVAARLKLSNKMRESMARRMQSPAPNSGNIRAIAYRTDAETARDVAMLFASDDLLGECIAKLSNWAAPMLAIKGGELIQMGLPAGPLVAKTLQAIEEQWIAEDFPATDRLQLLATEAVAAALSAHKNA
jgi:poly(A) polymerase